MCLTERTEEEVMFVRGEGRRKRSFRHDTELERARTDSLNLKKKKKKNITEKAN